MMSPLGKIPFSFTATLWLHPGPSGWVFVNVPKTMSDEIRRHFKKEEQGWGRLSVIAEIKNIRWPSAIWFDTHHHTYLLPIKSVIRKKEKINIGQRIEVSIYI